MCGCLDSDGGCAVPVGTGFDFSRLVENNDHCDYAEQRYGFSVITERLILVNTAYRVSGGSMNTFSDRCDFRTIIAYFLVTSGRQKARTWIFSVWGILGRDGRMVVISRVDNFDKLYCVGTSAGIGNSGSCKVRLRTVNKLRKYTAGQEGWKFPQIVDIFINWEEICWFLGVLGWIWVLTVRLTFLYCCVDEWSLEV